MSESFLGQIDELLNESIDDIKLRERTTFDKLAAPYGESIVLFGIGVFGRRTLAGLRKLGIEPVAFSDNNSQLWNKSVEGLPVLSPGDAVRKFGNTAVFVVAIWNDAIGHPLVVIEKQLSGYGPVKVISFGSLYWKYPEIFLPYFSFDLPHKICGSREHLLQMAGLLIDDGSREIYLGQLRWRLWLDVSGLAAPESGTGYQHNPFFEWYSTETFVDCGAFDGDTIRAILKDNELSFGQIIALEPDPVNYRKLCAYVATLEDGLRGKVIAMPVAAGACSGKLRFDAQGTEQSVVASSGNVEVEAAALDDLLGAYSPTYIKMDIEGAEQDAISGMRRLIKLNKPIIAISVYHKLDHLWQLPLMIHEISSAQYSFVLRAHAHAGWDLVCYAIPSHRLLKNVKGMAPHGEDHL